MRLSNILATVIGIISFVAPIGCSTTPSEEIPTPNKPTLNQYSISFNPLLNEHTRLFHEEFGEALAEAEKTGNQISQSSRSDNKKTTDAIAVLDRLTEALDDVWRKLETVNKEWLVLHPPSEAKRFHELTFEMMQLRLRTVDQTNHAYSMLAASQIESSEKALQKANDLDQQAERLFLDILDEARTLGNVQIRKD